MDKIKAYIRYHYNDYSLYPYHWYHFNVGDDDSVLLSKHNRERDIFKYIKDNADFLYVQSDEEKQQVIDDTYDMAMCLTDHPQYYGVPGYDIPGELPTDPYYYMIRADNISKFVYPPIHCDNSACYSKLLASEATTDFLSSIRQDYWDLFRIACEVERGAE